MPIKFLKQFSDFEQKIFERFKADIEKLANNIDTKITVLQLGREDDVAYMITSTEQIFADNANRVSMMADSFSWQAYQLGMAQAIFDEGKYVIEWNLDPGAEHCDTCIGYAATRYFTPETLPGIPGEANTICDGGCKCYLT